MPMSRSLLDSSICLVLGAKGDRFREGSLAGDEVIEIDFEDRLLGEFKNTCVSSSSWK
jgi:hypothetical protein